MIRDHHKKKKKKINKLTNFKKIIFKITTL